MEYRRLGQTDRLISRIGFGCAPASGYDYGPIDEREWFAAVGLALDRGVNFFDVADVYGFGRAEELLAEALGGKRREVVIATKCGLAWGGDGKVRRDLSKRWILSAVEGSLRRLRIDSIPLYQVHWPDPAIAIEDTMNTLARCQDEGKIQCIGVCNFSLDLLKRTHSGRRLESHQSAFNLLSTAAQNTFTWCDCSNISNIAHSGLARGFLAGRRRSDFDRAPTDASLHRTDTRFRSPYFSEAAQGEKERLMAAIRRASVEAGKSLASISLRWILDRSEISAVLVGIKSRQQLDDSLEAIDWRLAPETHSLLSVLAKACPEGLAGVPAHAA